MGNWCCRGGEKRDAVWVKACCEIRFPEVEDLEGLLSLIRYAVGKTEAALGHAPGSVKETTALTVIDLCIAELGSEEVQTIYASLGGREFAKNFIRHLCGVARQGKALTSGV